MYSKADKCLTNKTDKSLTTLQLENQTELKLYLTALQNLGINAKPELKNRSIRINDQKNLLKASSNELFKLHKERHDKFINGLLGRKRVQKLIAGGGEISSEC